MDQSLRTRVAKMLCVGFPGHSPDADLAGLVTEGVRSVILFARNAGSRADVAKTIAAVKRLSPDPRGDPIMICVDQEGGDTVRFTENFDPPPPMRDVGGAGVDAASAVGRRLAMDLLPVGIDLDLAPVMDVDSNPANPVIGPRSFGIEPGIVSACGAAMIDAMQSRGLGACAKHFPGHGDTDLDSHHDLPVLRHGMDRIRQIELPPFEAAIKVGVAAIMTTHVVFEAIDPGVPATMSRAAIEGLLRGELGFEGVVISDDLEMAAIADQTEVGEAAVRTVEAGVDLLLCCHRPERQRRVIEALAAAVTEGRLTEARIDESIRRLETLFDAYVKPPESA
jgi:beta-N-acetylhexosaminidase